MPRHVEGDDAKALRDVGIVQDATILPSIGAGRVQAQQRDPFARFLEIDAIAPAFEIERQVAADDRLERGRHCAAPFAVAARVALRARP